MIMNQVIKAEPQVLLSLFSEGSSLQIVAMAVAFLTVMTLWI